MLIRISLLLLCVISSLASFSQNLAPNYRISKHGIFEYYDTNYNSYRSTSHFVKDDQIECNEDFCYFFNRRMIMIIFDFAQKRHFSINQTRDFELISETQNKVFLRSLTNQTKWLIVDLASKYKKAIAFTIRSSQSIQKISTCEDDIITLTTRERDFSFQLYDSTMSKIFAHDSFENLKCEDRFLD